MKTPGVANLYNPHEQTREQLIASFVARSDVLQTLFSAIRQLDQSQPSTPYLLEGQRGMGKTTLLLRLSYEIDNTPELRAWLIPIVLKEEAFYGIRRLCALWETVAQELAEKDKAFAGLAEQMQAHTDPYVSHESACFSLLTQALDAHGKQVMLFIDNVGELFLNFSDQENRRFYEVVHTVPHVRLIGASPVVLKALLPEEHVFAEAFTTVQLEGLSAEETRRVLLELGRVYGQERAIKKILKQHPGRIEALRLLTGGVIRTVVLLFDVLTDRESGDSMGDLDSILDRVTPLYQSRMQDLTPVQRDLVNAIALNWEAMSVAEIAQKTRVYADDARAILRDLEQVFVVQPVGGEGDDALYQLRERFFNIWYLMRLAPGANRSKVLWLLHFLETWYDRAELRQHAQRHAESVAAGEYSAKEAYYVTEAFANTGQLDLDTEDHMLAATRKLLQQVDAALAEDLTPSDKDLYKQAHKHYQRGDYEQACALFAAMKFTPEAVLFEFGDACEQIGAYAEARQHFAEAAERQHLDALVRLGLIAQRRFHDYAQADACFQQAGARGSVEALLYAGALHADALNEPEEAERLYLRILKETQARTTILTSGRFSLKAMKSYLLTAIKGEESDTEHARLRNFNGAKDQYVQILDKARLEAMFQLGNLYANQLKNPAQAEHYYTQAAAAGHLAAAHNLGVFYQYQQQEPHKAIPWYQQALERGAQASAALNLAMLYQNDLRDEDQAETYYRLACDHGDVGALNGLAWLYFQQRRHRQEALHYAWKAVEQKKNMYTAHTLACICLWSGRTTHAANMAREFMYNPDAYTALEDDILFYLQLLLAKGEYATVFEYFDDPELGLADRFTPLVYAIFYLTGDARYNRLPTELAEPVDAILQRIEQLAREYA
jgi:TPR repeat protein